MSEQAENDAGRMEWSRQDPLGYAPSTHPAAPVVMTRYRTKVHARNVNSDYGIPVDVFATSKQDAVNKAVAVGWSGRPSDARVTVLSVEQVYVVPTPTEDAR